MAQLRDVPRLLKAVGPFEFAMRVWRQIRDDNLFTWAASLAYSWLFALFPFLLFLLALIPYLPERLRHYAEHFVDDALQTYLAAEAARTIRDNIQGNVKSLLHQPRGMVLYAGLLVALWAASGGIHATMSALDRCYELDRGRPFYKQRLLAIFMTIGSIFILIVVAALLPIAGAVRDWVVNQPHLHVPNHLVIVFDISRWFLSIVFLLLVLGMIYWKGPAIRHRFHLITPGAIFCVTAWILLGLVLRYYMNKMGEAGYDRTYGALGGVAMLLLLFYVDALVLLIGAEINSEIDFEVLKIRRGSADFRKAEEPAAPEPATVAPATSAASPQS
jgi:membrane protein